MSKIRHNGKTSADVQLDDGRKVVFCLEIDQRGAQPFTPDQMDSITGSLDEQVSHHSGRIRHVRPTHLEELLEKLSKDIATAISAQLARPARVSATVVYQALTTQEAR